MYISPVKLWIWYGVTSIMRGSGNGRVIVYIMKMEKTTKMPFLSSFFKYLRKYWPEDQSEEK